MQEDLYSSLIYYDILDLTGAYSYGYEINDSATGNIQFRNEDRYPNGTVVGSYGYIDQNGNPKHYQYVADERGYR